MFQPSVLLGLAPLELPSPGDLSSATRVRGSAKWNTRRAPHCRDGAAACTASGRHPCQASQRCNRAFAWSPVQCILPLLTNHICGCMSHGIVCLTSEACALPAAVAARPQRCRSCTPLAGTHALDQSLCQLVQHLPKTQYESQPVHAMRHCCHAPPSMICCSDPMWEHESIWEQSDPLMNTW
jgi:hypothetical protein